MAALEPIWLLPKWEEGLYYLTPEVTWVMRSMRHQPEWSFKISSTPVHLWSLMNSECLDAPSFHSLKKFILHDSLSALLLPQLGHSYNKGNDFSSLPPHLCFPNHRVGLDIEWRNCWGLAQTPPFTFSLYYSPPTSAATSLILPLTSFHQFVRSLGQ